MSLKLSATVRTPGNVNWTAIFYGTLLAIITSIILMAVGGTVMYYTVFNERLIPVFGLAIVFISIFLGGLISARRAGKLGWFHGLAVGILFLFLTILFNVLVPGGIFGFAVFKKIVASVVAGCLGGIWGVGQN
ncbi:MAG: TIGR04086 family membrane protein [Eubacteriales bacterium]